MVDLQNPGKWALLLDSTHVITMVSATSYTPILPFFLSFNEPILVAGASSASAKQHWYLGATMTQYLDVSPSATPPFSNLVEVGERKKIPLKGMIRLDFQNYGIYPYRAKIEVPYYLEDVRIQVWEFFGKDSQIPSIEYISGLSLETNAIVQGNSIQLTNIETQISNLQNP